METSAYGRRVAEFWKKFVAMGGEALTLVESRSGFRYERRDGGKGNDGSALEFPESLDGRVLDEENRAGGIEELQVAVRGKA